MIQGNKVLWDTIEEQSTLSNKSTITDAEGYRIAELESSFDAKEFSIAKCMLLFIGI